MIQFANISVVLLLFVVLLFTLLTAGPDKKAAKPAKGGEKSAEKRRFSAAEVAKHCTAARRLARLLCTPSRSARRRRTCG